MSGATGAATEIIPVVFDGHSGSLHRPSVQGGNGAAIIICAPAGRDARWTYRALFQWAERLAASGYIVLRYDLLGEGDSLGLDDAADQWASWTKGVRQAADFLRAQTGAAQLFVCGLRIGATLACVTAEDVKPDGLILWDPLSTGKVWLKELRLAYAMQAGAHFDEETIECNGLYLSAATIQALESVNIIKEGVTWPPLLLASPVGAKRLLAAFGAQAESTQFAGYAAFFKDSYVNQAPAELFNSTLQWLEKQLALPSSSVAPVVAAGTLQTSDWREERVCFGPGLRGVLCLPARKTGVQAVIFGNTGGDPRAGVANFSTRASRLLAAEGIAALRFDFAGLGESEGSDVHVYETNRTEEMRAAAALLAERGFGEVTTAGVCTGGFHAVRAVVEDSGINRAVAINAWLVWEPGRDLDRAAHVESMRSVYLRAPVQARKWMRIVRESWHTIVVSRLAGLQRALFPRPAAQAARTLFVRASARNAHIHILAGAMDRSLEGLEHFGARGRWLTRQRGISITILPDLDHALTTKKSQGEAVKELLSFIRANTPLAGPVTGRPTQSAEIGFRFKETPGTTVMPEARPET